MDRKLVDTAEKFSRKRALIVMLATVVYFVVQWLNWPQIFLGQAPTTSLDLWLLNSLLLLLVMATGGGLLQKRSIRELVQDEVSRLNLNTAAQIGYWVAMVSALVLYLTPWLKGLTAKQGSYIIVTVSIVIPMLSFVWLEHRALKDA